MLKSLSPRDSDRQAKRRKVLTQTEQTDVMSESNAAIYEAVSQRNALYVFSQAARKILESLDEIGPLIQENAEASETVEKLVTEILTFLQKAKEKPWKRLASEKEHIIQANRELEKLKKLLPSGSEADASIRRLRQGIATFASIVLDKGKAAEAMKKLDNIKTDPDVDLEGYFSLVENVV